MSQAAFIALNIVATVIGGAGMIAIWYGIMSKDKA